MVKNHLKLIAAPKSWPVQRKKHTFITRPMPGPHPHALGVPLSVVLKDMLSYGATRKEIRRVLLENDVLVDGIRRREHRFIVGVFDTISFTKINAHYRMSLTTLGKLTIVGIPSQEAMQKPCKIIGKKILKGGKLQLNLFDGKNMKVENGQYSVGDSVLLSLPSLAITQHFKLQKNAAIFLSGGTHIGESGIVEDILGEKLLYKNPSGEIIETLKRYAFVVGTERSAVTIQESKK